MPIAPLDPSKLFTPSGADELGFDTTDALESLEGFPGQERAIEAIEFGIGIRHEGYNLFAVGSAGSGRHSLVQTYLERDARKTTTETDWCYVHNFEQAHRPLALALPRGQVRELRTDMRRLVDDLESAIAATFETQEYRRRHAELEQQFASKQEAALADVQTQAEAKGLAVVRAAAGIAVAPTKDGKVIDPETFKQSSKEEQATVRAAIKEVERDLARIPEQVPLWRRETDRKLRDLAQTATRSPVRVLIKELFQKYETQHSVVTHLHAVEQDVIENAGQFRKSQENPDEFATWARRYAVNALDDRPGESGAAVIYETNPTFQNLFGRVEYQSYGGTLITDFTLIKPGALHRANGGYLVIDAGRLLTQPLAWNGIKRALQTRQIVIESADRLTGRLNTVSLDPEPIALNIKIVLVGERHLYYALCHYDPDFGELFKVVADFDDASDRTQENDRRYARVIATVARNHSLRPFSAAGVGRILEHTARLAGDAERLSTSLRELVEILKESDYWADDAGADVVEPSHVQHALDAKTRRLDRVRERLYAEIERGTVLIETSGESVGQINGLSVLQAGGFVFGQPNRITARVRLGTGSVVDIEREVKLGGPLHSKGVLILSGYLAGRYLTDRPLSLAASLVFEQNYGGVDGDSASSAEIYALLSALAELPIRQSLAVTGAVSQQGQVQAIGGVNEKIEGFFDICRVRGLTGEEGVVIPSANVKHLMLRADVVEAVRFGQFSVYAIETVDQGIELLTGHPAGDRDESGAFPEGTVNRRVEERLLTFAEESLAYREAADGLVPDGSSHDDGDDHGDHNKNDDNDEDDDTGGDIEDAERM